MAKWQRSLYQPKLPLGKNGERVTACEAHVNLSKEAAKEGMVLLKNQEKLLPLQRGTKIALFGKATFDYVKGGGGSGDVTVSYTRNLYDGFQKLGDHVSIYEELAGFYQEYVKEQYSKHILPGQVKEPELSEELCKKARNFTDTAIISICRFSGEGWDRKSEDDFYLTKEEKAMVEQVKSCFPHIIVVLNVGGMVDTSWFAKDPSIQSVLLAWQGGIEGGLAAAELLCGFGIPSGKLSDTFAESFDDYPSAAGFHESEDYVDYSEDIYVGYRYFETIPGVREKVNYPFGYGLSYTEFQWKVLQAQRMEDEIAIQIQVVNTGSYPGKEVLQVYVQAPQGVLGKAKKSLAAFQKTRLLQPGELQILTLKFHLTSQASFDDLGKIQKSAYILEAGVYTFFVGTSVMAGHTIDFTYEIKENRVVEQLTSKLAPVSLAKRMMADGNYEELPMAEPVDTDANVLPYEDKTALDGMTPQTRSLPGVCLWKWPYKDGIRPFSEVAEGNMTIKEFLAQMTDEEVAHLLGGQPNTGVSNTFGIGNMPEYGIPTITTADGPAGLRIDPQCGINTTAWPCSTMLACTWNPELVYQVGQAGAEEVKENNIGVWLTPAVNIHRSPLCGRNFEYYSEDPLLAGKLAAEMVKGIQSCHIGAAVKHFALNNKETNRKNSDSHVSERAAREIYLKVFEIIVKEANPWCIMTSYNIVNGHRASENTELIQGILRDEWGFDGMVTTDWWTLGEHYKEVKAGNDLKMACGSPQRLLAALKEGALSRQEMDACAEKILQLILKIDD